MQKKEPAFQRGQLVLPPSWKERQKKTYPNLSPAIFDAFFALRRTSQRVDNMYASWLAGTGLTPAKIALLMLMWAANDEAVSFSSLGSHLSVGRATISGLVDGLVRDGFLNRREDPVDRRNSLAELSASGRKRLRSIMDDHSRRLTAAFGKIDPHELEALTHLLNHFANAAEAGDLPVAKPAPRRRESKASSLSAAGR
ncbi:MAG TPA: MarR family transcriptional regulator [Ramlibacter sp.]|uniref:MarR family winged helix-turn-helix transcriptional regulator n=1 Tax=Ramlibacter sp. TaxID=1917967 RepID=UPI002CC4BB77|nr:MarR family transcriptional regulator [Ramlibacter sp.]HVZ45840.1 MarR family transcriptional regulator [Ramlibacter sp.]